MRILLVTPFLPYSGARHAGGFVLSTLAKGLAAHAEVGLAAIASRQEQQILAAEPSPWSWSTTALADQRPGGLARLPFQLRMLWRWRNTPLGAAKSANAAMAAALQRARREFEPDVVFVEMAQMAQYLPLLEGVPTIFTDHEAGCPANTRTGLGPIGDRRDQRMWWRYVRRFYPMATSLQALTAEDAAVLAEKLDRPVGVRPPVFPVADVPVQPGEAPPRALFLGDYAHGPNPEAATHLAHEVLPRMRSEYPDAELWLAGANQERIAALGQQPGVRLLGFVPDLAELLGQVRALLAPVFSGAGVRTKCIAALAHGLPVVTNPLGAQGAAVPEPARTVAEGPQALADATLALLRSPSFAADAGRRGYEWARANVDTDAVAAMQVERAAALLD